MAWYAHGMTTDTPPQQSTDVPLSEVVRRNIRGGIVRAGYTQVVFAIRVLGRNPSWLGRRLRKDSPAPIAIEELGEIAHALGVTPEELLRR